jgi:hypothetical protein
MHGLLRGYLYSLYVDDIRASQEHTYGLLQFGTGIALCLYMQMIFVSGRKQTYLWASAACCGDIFRFLYADDARTSQDTHIPMGLHCLLRR